MQKTKKMTAEFLLEEDALILRLYPKTRKEKARLDHVVAKFKSATLRLNIFLDVTPRTTHKDTARKEVFIIV